MTVDVVFISNWTYRCSDSFSGEEEIGLIHQLDVSETCICSSIMTSYFASDVINLWKIRHTQIPLLRSIYKTPTCRIPHWLLYMLLILAKIIHTWYISYIYILKFSHSDWVIWKRCWKSSCLFMFLHIQISDVLKIKIDD